MLLSLNKLSLVILTVSALISLAYSSSTSPSATAASATTSGNTNTATQPNSTTSLPSSSNTNTTTNAPSTSTAAASTTTPTSSNQPSPTSSSLVPNPSTNGTTAPNPTEGSNPTTASPSSTTSTTPTTTPAPLCINQNCSGSFANLSCLNANGTTCDPGTGFCFQTVTSNGTSSMVYTGCVATCEAMVSTATNYTEDRRCCQGHLCNLQVISLPPGSSSTRATSCFWLMLIFVVCVFLS